MRKYSFPITYIVLFIFCVALTHTNPLIAQTCNAKFIAKKAKSNITPPYKYDSYAVTEIVFDKKKEKKMKVNFQVFEGIKYKILFFNSGFDQPVSVNIYDKSAAIKNRIKLYDSSEGIDNDYWQYYATQPGKYYIEYIIPKSTSGEEKTGCIVMLIGAADAEEIEKPKLK